MAFNVIETHVLEMIGENTSSPDVFKDTDLGIEPIRDSVNDAIQEIIMLTGSKKTTYHLPLIKDQSFYKIRLTNYELAYITDVFSINNKYRLSQTDMIKLSKQNPRWMVNHGTPREYLHIGKDVFGVYPRSSATSDMIEITMVVVPKNYTSGNDRIMLRDNFKWACVHYVVSEYYASRGDARSAIDHHQKYLELLGLQSVYQEYDKQSRFRTSNELR